MRTLLTAGPVPTVSRWPLQGRRIDRLLGALLVILWTAGCATVDQSLPEHYGGRAQRPRPPLIIIPGMMGSRLVDPASGEERWPLDLWDVLIGDALDRLWGLATLPMREQLAAEPQGLVMRSLGQDHYERLIRRLERDGNYRCRDARNLEPGTDCILFAWDWRRDLVHAAARLDRLIDRIRAQRGDPHLRVDLLAHSAGGLIARYYARFGANDVLDADPQTLVPNFSGADNLRRVLLLGVPNEGSISGLQLAMKGYRLGVGSIPPELIATMPSVYQLLPHPERAWMMDSHGRRVDRDLYNPSVWETYHVSVYDPEARRRIRRRFDDAQRADAFIEAVEDRLARGLERGRRFHLALSSAPPQPPPLRFDVLGADCLPTPAKCLVETVEDTPVIRLHPEQVVNKLADVDYRRLMLEPGDGRVTKPSLLAVQARRDSHAPFPVRNLVLTCADHSQLPGSFAIAHNALNALNALLY